MTRAAQVTKAGGAMRKARAAPSSASEPAPMTFLVFEDNAGDYHSAIVAASGETLAQSASFASYAEAERAARIVHRGASQASFEARSGDTPPAPVDLPARRDRAKARDALDAQRWLDEGGSHSVQAVAG